MPAPEGIHRDGVDFVLTLLVNRQNIDGGISGIYSNDSDEPIETLELKKAGSYIFLDDNAVRHGVTGINPIMKNTDAYRDTLIAMFIDIT